MAPPLPAAVLPLAPAAATLAPVPAVALLPLAPDVLPAAPIVPAAPVGTAAVPAAGAGVVPAAVIGAAKPPMPRELGALLVSLLHAANNKQITAADLSCIHSSPDNATDG
jgi:hypothetical protein